MTHSWLVYDFHSWLIHVTHRCLRPQQQQQPAPRVCDIHSIINESRISHMSHEWVTNESRLSHMHESRMSHIAQVSTPAAAAATLLASVTATASNLAKITSPPVFAVIDIRIHSHEWVVSLIGMNSVLAVIVIHIHTHEWVVFFVLYRVVKTHTMSYLYG